MISFMEKYKSLFLKLEKTPFKTKKINEFINTYKYIPNARTLINRHFVYNEKLKYRDYFTNVENKSLDNQQQETCIINDDYSLVIAGAGSGKTLTICAKIGYLIKKGVKPNEILCISFTNKVCDELKERLKKITGYDNINVKTFHKLGLEILQSNKISYKIADENRTLKFLRDSLNEIRNTNSKAMTSNVAIYCENYLSKKFGKVEKLVTAKDIINSIQQDQELQKIKKGKPDLITIAKENVKSIYELEIANILFLHGIKYQYEPEYKYNVKLGTHYRPDFYLPEYDIYIEHFGIDESGKASWLKDENEIKKYHDDMDWKKELHQTNKTTLIETFSYQRDNLIPELEKKLIEHGVNLQPIAQEYLQILQSEDNFEELFLQTVSSFIKLFKNRELELKDFYTFFPNASPSERNTLYLIKEIYIRYQSKLKKENLFDFEDMINYANKLLSSGKYSIGNYKYIIVDEYQDVSINKINLLKHLLKINNAKLTAFGDDWQSIYRFAGSEVCLITKFNTIFPNSVLLKIEKTYRNSKQLIDVSGNFIKKNKAQIDKNLLSDKTCEKPIIIYAFTKNLTSIPLSLIKSDDDNECYQQVENDPRIRILNRFLEDLSNNYKSLLILTRNNYEIAIIQYWLKNKDNRINVTTNNNQFLSFTFNKMRVDCMTIHKSKGLEADNVVLFDIKEGYHGLPDTLGDDKILKFVIASDDEIEYGEDRRLFYVALTRTKNKVYIITGTNEISRFIEEISNDINTQGNLNYLKCPQCGAYLVKIPNKNFYGCSNFYLNNCTYTIKCNNDDELFKIRFNENLIKSINGKGTYLSCKIIKMEKVELPQNITSLKITYLFDVGNSHSYNFTTYLNNKLDEYNSYRVARFIITLRNNDTLDPFNDFEKFSKKYTGKIQNVHIVRNNNGILQPAFKSDWYFKEYTLNK